MLSTRRTTLDIRYKLNPLRQRQKKRKGKYNACQRTLAMIALGDYLINILVAKKLGLGK
jgi:hypothetical protein